MKRLAIVVEGPTEREFVQRLLVSYLQPSGVYPYPISLGGNVTVPRLASEMVKLHWNFDCVSSLVDFYGFRGKANMTPNELENLILETIMSNITVAQGNAGIIPYVQRYEFEGLLFSRVDAFSDAALASERDVRQLREIRSLFQTPEDINDGYDTAPNKRIKRIIRKYRKVVYGPLIAESAGLDTIRAECPRFSAWLGRLESLGNP